MKAATRSSLWASLWLVGLLAGCNGGGGGSAGEPSDTAGPGRTPEPTGLEPARDDMVSVSTLVRAGFGVLLDSDSIDQDSLRLERAGIRVPGTVTEPDDATTDVIEFTPDEPLVAGSRYTAFLSPEVKAVGHDPLGEAVEWSFETEPASQGDPGEDGEGDDPGDDGEKLEPLDTPDFDPIDGAQLVELDAPIRAIFDQPLAAASAKDAIELTAAGQPIGGSVLPIDDGATEIEFVPDAPLAPATTYVARLSGDVEGTQNAPLGTDEIWTFTTKADEPPVAEPPKVASTTPGVGGEVSLDPEFVVEFDTDMHPGSIGENTIQVFVRGEEFPTSVPVLQSPRFVRFGAQGMPLLRPCELFVSGSVQSLDLVSMGAPVTVSFATRDGRWNDFSETLSGKDDVRDPDVAISATGEATAVFREPANGGGYRIVGRRLGQSGVWSTGELLDLAPGSKDPRVAMDASGRAVATFEAHGVIYTNEFDGSWLGARVRSAGNDDQHDAVVSSTPDGRIIVAWVAEALNGDYHIRVARRQPGGNWVNPVDIAGPFLNEPRELRLAMDDDGRAALVYLQRETTQAARYRVFGMTRPGWTQNFEAPTTVDVENLIGASDLDVLAPDVAIADGVAIATWIQNTSPLAPGSADWRERLWINRRDLSQFDWDGGQLADDFDQGPSSAPSVAMSPDGRSAMIAWTQDNRFASSHLDPGGPLAPAFEFGPQDLGTRTEAIELQLDGNGNGLAIHRQRNVVGTYDSVVRRYDAVNDTWSPASPIEITNASTDETRLAVSPTGKAVAVWSTVGPIYRIESNVFQ